MASIVFSAAATTPVPAGHKSGHVRRRVIHDRVWNRIFFWNCRSFWFLNEESLKWEIQIKAKAQTTHHAKCQLDKKRTFETTYLGLLWTYWRFILYPWANQKSCLFWGPVVHRRNGLPNMGPLKRLEKNEPQEGQQALSMMCDLQLCPCRES